MKFAKTLLFQKQSIIFRLFLMLMATILPIMIVGMFFLSWSKAQIQKEIESSAHTTIFHIVENFSAEIQHLSYQANRLLNMNLFTFFSVNHKTLTQSQYYISLRDQYDLIKSYPDFYPLLEDVIVFYSASSIAVTASQGLISDADLASENIISELRSPSAILKGYDNTLFLGFLYPSSSRYNDDMPEYYLTMQLSPGYITEILDASSQNNHTLMYHHPTHSIFFDSSAFSPEEYDAYLNYADTYITQHPESNSFSWSDKDNYIVAEYSPYLGCTFMQVVPLKEIFSIPNILSNVLFIYFVIALLAICLFCFFSVRMISRPLGNLLAGYQAVENGDFSIQVTPANSSLEFSMLIQGFNQMTSQLKLAMQLMCEYQIYSQKMELKQLQMQMNPHFLYNTYFILHRLIKCENIEEATQLSSYLGSYFQYITRNSNDMVPLKKEWEHAENYLKIQQIRFAGRVSIQYDSLPENYADFSVPRLILQPLLENALEHGVKNVSENGKVTVRFIEACGYIEIQVDDNGNTLEEETVRRLESEIHSTDSSSKEFTALHNIHRRLQLVYGNDACLKLVLNMERGLSVHVLIPTARSMPETFQKGENHESI